MRPITPSDISEVLTAIREERRASGKKIPFKVARTSRRASLWEVVVDDADSRAPALRDTYEGYVAWWPSPSRGAGEVLTVDPEKDCFYIRFASAPPPPPGEMIFLIPLAFLDALEAAWQNPEWTSRIAAWLAQCSGNAFDEQDSIPLPPASTLRKAQRDAFRLPGWRCAFLWGPPGTGKSHTLGELLAAMLLRDTRTTILLLSTTNTAVDQAIVAVDRAIERRGNSRAAQAARDSCARIGSRFEARRFHEREHLIPVADVQAIQELMRVEAERPDPQDVIAYHAWKTRWEAARKAVRTDVVTTILQSRVSAMTTTLAAFQIEDIRASGRAFDWVVFDEASQVSIPHALALAPLGRKALFAGDPRQLSPIVQARHPSAKKWLGESPFEWMERDGSNSVLLDEQSRMAEPICKVVSGVFYDGKLRVAEDALRDPKWRSARELASVTPIGNSAACVLRVDRHGAWSPKYGGPLRWDSAELVAALVSELTGRGLANEQILVVTPFHSQRTLIRQKLRNSGVTGISISTVHKCQGGERHTVIFDPVEGDNKFFTEIVDCRRLVNVAVSRAMARLVLVLSAEDLRTTLFGRIATVIAPPRPTTEAEDVTGLVMRSDFPACAMGRTIRIKQIVGIVVDVLDGGRRFQLQDLNTGQTRVFVTEYVRKSAMN